MTSNYFEFVEELPNFSVLNYNTQDLQKFQFADSQNDFNFYILYKESVPHLNDCFMIYLHKTFSLNFQGEKQILSKISILDAENKKFNTQINKSTFTSKNQYSPVCGGVFFIQREHILDPQNGLLVDGKLRIHFEVELLNNENSASKILDPKVNPTIEQNSTEKALEDYESLLESFKHSDVVFVIGKDSEKKEFQLHKNILATRSKVFDAMLKVDCEEKRNNRVEITDMTVPVFEEMIRYIYTGKIGEGLELYAEELLEAADKYQFDLLKSKAARELASKLSIESVSGVLLLSDMHFDEELKMDCIKYITEHAKLVMQTEEWKRLIGTQADLMVLLYEDIVNSK